MCVMHVVQTLVCTCASICLDQQDAERDARKVRGVIPLVEDDVLAGVTSQIPAQGSVQGLRIYDIKFDLISMSEIKDVERIDGMERATITILFF